MKIVGYERVLCLLTFTEGLKYQVCEENVQNFAGNTAGLYERLTMKLMYSNGTTVCLAADGNDTWDFVGTVMSI